MINKEFQTFLKKQKLNRKNTIILEANFSNLANHFESTSDFIETLTNFFDAGNIIVPAFTDKSVLDGDHFNLSIKTDSGEISQTIVDMKESFRSVHPTHSFCILGKDKIKLGRKHESEKTPLGKKCPLALTSNAKLVFIDSDINNSAYCSHLEQMNKVPYLFKKGTKATYHINNKPLKYIPYVKSQYGFNSKFKEIVSLLNVEPVYFNGIEIYILDAKQVKNIFKSKIEENPYYFITKN